MKNRKSCLFLVCFIFAIFINETKTSAQYVHFTGQELEALIVGHRVTILPNAMTFGKNGHLLDFRGNSLKETYSILPDGQLCFNGSGSFVYRFGSKPGIGNLGKCIKVVRSGPHYIALNPNDGRDLFMFNIY